jgi:quercetin dioxygenase-like cupin family protein
MTKTRCEINFQDDRGTIADIFANNPKDHITIITSKKGAVRANHYHKQSTQYTFVISGKVTVLTRRVGGGEVTEEVVGPYEMVTHPPNEIHTIIADEDTVFLAFADGVRGGAQYENDTFRVSAEESGLEQFLARRAAAAGR